MKKLMCLFLAMVLTVSMLALGSISAAAEEEDSGKTVGGYGVAGEYTPSDERIVTQHLMFAMPGAWQNELTKDPRCGGAAGCYWWSGFDTPDARFGHGWPGYKTVKVEEEGVENLFAIDVPTYWNGDNGNATMIIWNNYLDSGTETDPAKNPFYRASAQTRDFAGQYYSKDDEHEYYDELFRYVYKTQLVKIGVDAVADLDLYSDTFWEDLNKAAADYAGYDYYRLSADDRTICADWVLDDELDELDLSEFGDYASNFWNSDLDNDDHPAEDAACFGVCFNFDNMVFVVNFDSDKMQISPMSGKIGYYGDFYFYYGNGEYGTWPTKELNEEMGGLSGNFASEEFYDSEADQPYYSATGKIYFEVPSTWKNFQRITFYLYEHGDEGGEIITWGSRKGYMTDEGNGVWSYDLESKGFALSSNKNYGCIFTADWGIMTCDLIIGADSIGDTAYCDGSMIENYMDSNKKGYKVSWKSGKYGVPRCITSIGNVIGDEYWSGESAYSLFVKFLSSTGKDGIDNALKYNGKTVQQTIDDTAAALGLGKKQIKAAIAESGRSFEWSDGSSSGGDDSSGNYVPTSSQFVFSKKSDGTYEITDYSGESKFVVLPDSVRERIYMNGATTDSAYINGYVDVPVTSVGDWVFYNNKYIQNVYIPESITHIGRGAFYGCVNLKSVDVPDSVTEIASGAFEKCLSLERASLGSGITEIADDTFFDCRRLAEVSIPDGVLSVGEEAFYNCRSLKELILPETVQSIGSKDSAFNLGVFEDCRSLERIRIPAGVKMIGENAFENCQKLTVFGKADSTASDFAGENGIRFLKLGRTTADGDVVGDINCDWDVNINDATLLQSVLAGLSAANLTDTNVIALLDVNNDGKVNIRDVTEIQRYAAEFIAEI